MQRCKSRFIPTGNIALGNEPEHSGLGLPLGCWGVLLLAGVLIVSGVQTAIAIEAGMYKLKGLGTVRLSPNGPFVGTAVQGSLVYVSDTCTRSGWAWAYIEPPDEKGGFRGCGFVQTSKFEKRSPHKGSRKRAEEECGLRPRFELRRAYFKALAPYRAAFCKTVRNS